VFGYTVRAKDGIRDCITRVIDESDLDRYTAVAKDETWKEANLPGARGLAPNPFTSTTYWVRPVPREQAKVIDLRAAHGALVLAAGHLFSREGHSSAYTDAARARDDARDALARYRKTPTPGPAAAKVVDVSDEFRTLCAYARNYVEEYGDKAEVDKLERFIASLSRRLALDA
jgi:hypothetical protein